MNLKPNKLVLLLISLAVSAESFSQKVPKSTGSKVSQIEAQEALDFHNKVRKDVGSAPLEWSAELAKYAQAWADHLAKDNDCKMQHRPNDGKWKQIHGENIYWSGGTDSNATDASEMWYSEIKDYKLTTVSSANFSKTGHYTQMVWKNTTKVGIGQAVCPTGAMIIVGNYSPPGNYIGEKPY
jgi:pathogenesis-related protein 1